MSGRSPATREGWRCPTCGRRFRQRTKEHSCALATLDSHLERASPDAKATFAALRDALASIGPHAVVPVKTMILLRGAANFGNVVVRRDGINLEFVLRRALTDTRILKRQPLGPGRYTHHIRLSSPADVDGQVVGWLRESHQTLAR